jgi:hypothetical protein
MVVDIMDVVVVAAAVPGDRISFLFTAVFQLLQLPN